MDFAKDYESYGEKVAPHFDRDSFQIYQYSRDIALAQIQRHFTRKAPSILDLGMGTASLLLELWRQYPDADLSGLELFPEMILKAREKLKNAGGPAIRIFQDDAHHLLNHFSLSSMDLVTLHYLLHFLDQERVMAEIFKVLRPGGFFSLATTTRDSFSTLQALAKNFISAEELDFLIKVPRDSSTAEALLQNHGFSLVESFPFQKSLRFEDFEELRDFVMHSGWLVSSKIFNLREPELSRYREFGKNFFPIEEVFCGVILLAQRR